MSNWRALEEELIDIIRRILVEGFDFEDLSNGDKAIVNWSFGHHYEVLNLSELARQLNAVGVEHKAKTMGGTP